MKLHAHDLGTCGASQAFYAGTVKFDTEGIADGVKICDIPKGLIFTKAVANVKTAFNAATTNVLTVGFNTDKNELIGASDITEGTAGTYAKEIWVEGGTNDAIYAKYTQTGAAATAGEAEIYLMVVPAPID